MHERRHLTFANVASATALVVAVTGVGGLAVADGTVSRLAKSSVTSKNIKNGTIKAADLKDGAVTGDTVADGSITGADVSEASLAQVPAAVSANVAADSGDVLRAVVRPNGTLATAQSEHALAASGSTGIYLVTFDRNISACTYAVSSASAGGALPLVGHEAAAINPDDPTKVNVWTLNVETNNFQAQAFHLIVAC